MCSSFSRLHEKYISIMTTHGVISFTIPRPLVMDPREKFNILIFSDAKKYLETSSPGACGKLSSLGLIDVQNRWKMLRAFRDYLAAVYNIDE